MPIGLQFVELYAVAAVIVAAFVFDELDEDEDELELDEDDDPHPASPSAATPAVAAEPARNVRRESCGCFINLSFNLARPLVERTPK